MATDLLELGAVDDVAAIRAARTKKACEAADGIWRKPPPRSKLKGVCARRPGSGLGYFTEESGACIDPYTLVETPHPRYGTGTFFQCVRPSVTPRIPRKGVVPVLDIAAIRVARTPGECVAAGGTVKKAPTGSTLPFVCAKPLPWAKTRTTGLSSCMGDSCGAMGAIRLLPEKINFGMLLLGNGGGVLLTTALPRIIEAMVKKEKKVLASRIAKVVLGSAGVTTYLLTKKSLPLGLAFGTLPGAVEAIASLIGDAIAKPIEKAKKGAVAGVGQIEPAQIREIKEIAKRIEGGVVGQVAETLEEYKEEEVPISPGIPSPMGASILS